MLLASCSVFKKKYLKRTIRKASLSTCHLGLLLLLIRKMSLRVTFHISQHNSSIASDLVPSRVDVNTTTSHWSRRFCFDVDMFLQSCDCPDELVPCDTDPCVDAVCPAVPGAKCHVSFCGACEAYWVFQDKVVNCLAQPKGTYCNWLKTTYHAWQISPLYGTVHCLLVTYSPASYTVTPSGEWLTTY